MPLPPLRPDVRKHWAGAASRLSCAVGGCWMSQGRRLGLKGACRRTANGCAVRCPLRRAPVALPAAEQCAQPLPQIGEIMLLHNFIADLIDQTAQIPLELGPALGRRTVILGKCPLPQHLGQRLRGLDHGAAPHPALAALSRSSGSWPSGSSANLSEWPGFEQWQRQVERAVGRLEARRVAVEAEDRLRRHASTAAPAGPRSAPCRAAPPPSARPARCMAMTST